MSFSDRDDDILSTKVKSFNIAPEDRKHMSMVRDDFVRADLDVFLLAISPTRLGCLHRVDCLDGKDDRTSTWFCFDQCD